ncbi:hypothetical protein Q7689_11785 [Nocardiopsis tropica]|uniref:Uncharacterized protein n=1 Tax=Nocardiopsis tropica TaxID=109330 RepID=A0ABV1ZPN2_9ACTN|nr:hypothetical protein [Nocardiopsis tropica]
MRTSLEPLLLFFALINLGGSVLALSELLVFPGGMLLSNAGLFYMLWNREKKRSPQSQDHPSAPPTTPPARPGERPGAAPTP